MCIYCVAYFVFAQHNPPAWLIDNVSHMLADREYEQEVAASFTIMPFPMWLRTRVKMVPNTAGHIGEELRAMSCPPSRRACSFRSMTSFGSHYKVELEEAGVQHVTFDSRVVELENAAVRGDTSNNGVMVELVRVGILKDILVLNYAHLNIVLMVVSWVAKDTEQQPRLRRDAYGFWLANMAARPRDMAESYLLPALASQVHP